MAGGGDGEEDGGEAIDEMLEEGITGGGEVGGKGGVGRFVPRSGLVGMGGDGVVERLAYLEKMSSQGRSSLIGVTYGGQVVLDRES